MNSYKEISILVSGRPPITKAVSAEARLVQEVGKGEYVRLVWEAAEYEVIPAGAIIYIALDEAGGNRTPRRLTCASDYKPTRQDESTYKYDVEFRSADMLWSKQIAFVYTYGSDGAVKGRECDWSFFGLLPDALQILLDSIKNETGKEWSVEVSETVNAATVNITAQSMSIASLCETIAQQLGVEWWCKYDDVDSGTLVFAECRLDTEAFPSWDLRSGVDIELPNVDNASGDYYNRFYIFGSTRNISDSDEQGSVTNAVASKRLTLDPEVYEGGFMELYGHIDELSGKYVSDIPAAVPRLVRSLTFDAVYPHEEYIINEVRAITVLNVDGTYKSTEYVITLTNGGAPAVFDPETDLVPGGTLSCVFNSGLLGGFEFGLKHYPVETTEISANTTPVTIPAGAFKIIGAEQSGTMLPSALIYPQSGDKLALLNVKMSAQAIVNARRDLAEAAAKEIETYKKDKSTFTFKTAPDEFAKAQGYAGNAYGKVCLGQTVNILYKDGEQWRQVGDTNRIIKIERCLDIPSEITITTSLKLTKGQVAQLREDVQNLSNTVELTAQLAKSTEEIISVYRETQDEVNKELREMASLWEKRTSGGVVYLYTKYDVVSAKGVTAYTSDGDAIEDTQWRALPIDGDTIYWQGDVLKAKGGSDFNTARMWQLLGAATAEQIALQHLTDALSGYATQGAVTAAVQALDVSAKGGAGKYIKSISQTDGKISATEGVLDKSAVGLGNVDNTSDASKRVAYAAASGDADTLDGQHASYFTQLITAAQTAANTAGSTANTANSTANAAKTKIDSLQVGGRNIFLGTERFDGTAWDTRYAWTFSTEDDWPFTIASRNGQWYGMSQRTECIEGEQYVFSFYGRGASASPIFFGYGDTYGTNPISVPLTFTDQWQRFSIAFTVTNAPYLRPRIENRANTLMQLAGLKLELGNIATDWTPAPEDGAPKLTKSRMLWGQPFDGTADVTGSMTIQGDILATGGVTAYTASDRRLKTDISGVSDAVRRLRDMGKVYEFAYIEDVNRARHIGMMWQEVREAMPQMCHEEGGYGRLNYLNTDYLNLLNAAIQELAERVERIEERLEERRER